MKKCSSCHQLKSFTEYYADKRTVSGLKCQCKKCHTEGNIRTRDIEKKRLSNTEHMARARSQDPKKFRERERMASKNRTDFVKIKARNLVNQAVKRGDIKRPESCESCHKPLPVCGHHDDYSKPLQVRWLCCRCHGIEHRSLL